MKVAGKHGNHTPAIRRRRFRTTRCRGRISPRTDAGFVRVERNYLHHNVMHNGGYGVRGRRRRLRHRSWQRLRHQPPRGGVHRRAYSGYVARFNYVLQGGYKQGSYYNQHFDVHGETDAATTRATAAPPVTHFEIAYNTIRGEQDYYVTKTRPAFMFRGQADAAACVHRQRRRPR